MKRHALYLCILLLCAVLASWPLFHAGLFTAHDIWHQVVRLHYYTQSIRDGQFPPAWISQLSLGRGYPLFYFSYHLPWMLGAPFVLAGLPVATSLKLLFFLSMVGSAITMYALCLNVFRNRVAATVGAAVYVWAPYHFLTLYVSAAIGTAYSFVWVPLLALGLWLSVTNKAKSGITLVAVSTAALILSHALTFVLILPFMALFALGILVLSQPNKTWLRKIFILIVGGVIGLLLSGFYLTPFLTYSKAIIASQPGNGFTDIYKSNFVSFSQLLYSKWGFGPIISNAKDGEISLQVGIVQWLGMAGALILLALSRTARVRKELSNHFLNASTFLITSVALFCVVLLSMTDASKPAWELINRYITLDYPFRLLLLAILFGSVGIAGIVAALKKPKLRIAAAAVLFAIAWYTNRNHVRVNMYTQIPLQDYIDAETTTNTFHEYLPVSADSSLFREGIPPLLEAPLGAQASDISRSISSTRFQVSLAEPTRITLSEFDFPGQQLYIDDAYTTHQSDDRGRITLDVPSGDHTIVRSYEQTAAQQTGIIQTVLGVLLLSKIALSTSKKQ